MLAKRNALFCVVVLLIPVVAAVDTADGAGTSSRLLGWFSRADSLVQDYDLLNSELVDRVNDEAALPNLLAAVDWLKMATGELKLDQDFVLPSKAALIQFTSLLKLMDPDEPRCDLEAYNILKENEKSAATDILVSPDELGPLRRIDAIIYEVAMDHAGVCRHEYPHLFQEAAKNAPKRTLREIKSMMDAIIATSKRLIFKPRDRFMDPRQVAVQKARGVSLRGYEEAVALLLNVRHRSQDDADHRFLSVKPDPRRRNRWIVNEPKVVQMLERYVYSRCEYLKRDFDHIMRPAELEQQLYSRGYKYRAINDRTAEFMIWLQYYRLCREITINKTKLEDNVIKAIWSELVT